MGEVGVRGCLEGCQSLVGAQSRTGPIADCGAIQNHAKKVGKRWVAERARKARVSVKVASRPEGFEEGGGVGGGGANVVTGLGDGQEPQIISLGHVVQGGDTMEGGVGGQTDGQAAAVEGGEMDGAAGLVVAEDVKDGRDEEEEPGEKGRKGGRVKQRQQREG